MDDYEQVAKGTLSWILSQMQRFALPAKDNPTFLVRLKPIGELILAADMLCSLTKTSSRFHQEGARIMEFCWRQMDGFDLISQVVSELPELVVLASIYPHFLRRGMHNRTFERILEDVVDIRGVRALEFPPWRALELATTFHEMGLKSPWKIGPTFRGTWLYSMPEPWSISESSAYSLTHTVFYMTRFGSMPRELPQRHQRYLRSWVPLWIEYYHSIANYDLLCEMIMVLRCIGEFDDPQDWDSWLLEFQRSDGMVPGPTHGLKIKRANEIEVFAKNYHTTLVGLMASLMSCKDL